MIGARTRLFVLLGRPVSHSLSPAMQNAAFRTLGIDAMYAALECASEDVASIAHAIARAGGGGNATVPHKEVLAAALDAPTPRATRLGSANTFWGEGNALHGESTDVDGVLDALQRLGAPATTWGIAGTGGSARAVIGAAAERGARVAVLSRDPARATALLGWAAELGIESVALRDCEVMINATPLGLGTTDPLPFAGSESPKATHALDLVYRRGATPWVLDCRRRGMAAADGREVLVAQGALALERWFPKQRAPREVMRAAVERHLG